MGRVPDAPADPAQPVLETRLVSPATTAPAVGRRITVGAVLARTLRVWWAHVGAFSAMALAVFAPLLAGAGLFAWSAFASAPTVPEPGALARRLLALVAGGALTLALSVVQMGAVTYGTVRWLNGERAPLGRMIAVGFRRGLPVVGTVVIVWLVTSAGALLLVVPGVVFLVAASVSIPAAVVERPGVVGAIRRSFELTRGSRWQLLAAGLVIVVVQWLLSSAAQLATFLLAPLWPGPWVLGASVLVSQVASALVSVISVVAIAVCYHDLRVTKEGVDTAELARVFE
jgi:hypothetical protein